MNPEASENYLDPDVAYLLGMIVARGKFVDNDASKLIVIEFPAKNLLAESKTKSFNQEEHLQQSLYRIRERLDELLEAKTEVKTVRGHVSLTIRFHSRNLTWRNLTHILGPSTSYHDFGVPQNVFDSTTDVKREFVRGVADCAGFIRDSNNYMGGKRRVYIEINNKNWTLPIQLCKLLQVDLNIPVQLIQWGHPNTREPHKKNGGTSWAKEHQVKIFAENFLSVGFYVDYKQQILEEFADEDREVSVGNLRKCNPNPKIRKVTKKPAHPGERDTKIPTQLRGRHFNAFWQICTRLGCTQCIATPQGELKIEVDE